MTIEINKLTHNLAQIQKQALFLFFLFFFILTYFLGSLSIRATDPADPANESQVNKTFKCLLTDHVTIPTYKSICNMILERNILPIIGGVVVQFYRVKVMSSHDGK